MGHLLTPAEAAKLLDYSEGHLKRLRLAGTGPKYLRLGARKIRYKEVDIIAWLNKHLVDPEEPNNAN